MTYYGGEGGDGGGGCRPQVDQRGFVTVDGVKIGRLVSTPEGPAIEICDKNPHRSRKRGTRLVRIPVSQLSKLCEGA